MTDPSYVLLDDRAVIEVKGGDAVKFLQGLVTNDVERLSDGEACHAGLLTPQGKLLFEFLVVRSGDRFLLDVGKAFAADLAKRLGFYKLRAKVEIAALDGVSVFSTWGPAVPDIAAAGRSGETIVSFRDPRLPEMGVRLLGGGTEAAIDAASYHAHRIASGVAEMGPDFTSGEVFPHEANMDQLRGVDFHKGCYVGQEVVSRMQHRGTARSRFVNVSSTGELPSAGTEIHAGGAPIGKLGSHVAGHGLAMVRLDRLARALDRGDRPEVDGTPVEITRPDWARYDMPLAKGDGEAA